jgi:hypothetical protein
VRDESSEIVYYQLVSETDRNEAPATSGRHGRTIRQVGGSGNIKGASRGLSGNIQGTFREHPGDFQGTFRES